ncbi:MAG: hypothetical protein A3J35_00060 [Gammaproteobacteria bacterium RIFCSPLOWO2_02_FULL_52_10]|nr:MAG: hypothetical protein A3J35_00060 [Gammaproteobacteria bacterium RIFCSPLOWO2_02_FULL_52_10]OGT83389.1 MAG: hypothetical protein A3G96_05485 [Gammaproteobacteria bacterium RIFCSPLOWO2_12_FULL_52_10]
MQYLDWKSEYKSGLECIDYEHKQLVNTINAVCENLAGKDAVEEVLEQLGLLYEKITTHFALEEKLMQEQQYHLYHGHKAQHAQLLENIRTMMDAYEDGSCDTCNKSLDECLISWFSQHFQTEHGIPIHFSDTSA